MTPREKHIKEIERVESVLKKTKSPHLKRDYTKYLNELKRDLEDYDNYMNEHKS